MPDFSIRSDTVDVEQIMEQIRARILEKRGVDYTEQQILELAAVKLEKFLDPRGLRSDLLEQFRLQQAHLAPLPNYAFESATLYDSHRAPLRWIRTLLRPLLKLFFNPNPLIHALHIQSQLNTLHAERRSLDQLYFEVHHNLIIELTRLGIELKNLKMRVESLTGRLEFNERRARALESVVVYKPDETDLGRRVHEPEETGERPAVSRVDQPASEAVGPGQRSRRRRRRRGRRGGGAAATLMTPPIDRTTEPVSDQAPADEAFDAASTNDTGSRDNERTGGSTSESQDDDRES